MRRQFLSLALAASGVATLAACDFGPDSTYGDSAALTAKVTSVRLDGIGAGSVTVRGGASKPALARTIQYSGSRPDGPTHRVTGGVLVLSGCGRHCSVSYTLDLPAGLPVSGDTSNGSVRLTRVGQVNVTTHSGSIQLDGVTGSVTAHTSNGRIEGRGLSGDAIEARTSNGSISLTPAKPQSIRAKTTNGSITLTVPAGPYQVVAHSSNSGRDIRIPNDPSARNHLDLTTSNGHITVAQA
ncbi:DUF4097 family beta strand repeat-containing protein [Actinomadura rupiterrae]|uniref:DUF4097 family beta strand repeat-containing protein n=1 Tax=Actinomadura rupiterrae TaxID=559627 RepID=UPI0020A50046|nr:DUF4097 family beta strand repeat-containing protein [Actinomadura rupiterrae]MCP2340283.1 hypothetical protein [Actinomadura rupiterrae]